MISNLRILLIALIAAATLLVPASAPAEYLVPEGNSAVNQYTEGFPTAGGERKTEGNKKSVTPAKAIGADNARKLEQQGSDGEAVVELATETAPESASPSGSAASETGSTTGGTPQDQAKEEPDSAPGPGKDDEDEGSGAIAVSGDGPDGSSGVSEVLGAATGSSADVGLLLPLVIVAALAWGLAFFWRQRRHPDPAGPHS